MAKAGSNTISEHEAAMRFAERHGEGLRYDHHRGRWYSWDGTIWRVNENGLAYDLMRAICSGGGLLKASHVKGALTHASNLRCFAVTSEIWDCDPWLLGTPAGTVDLRDGSMRRADQGDYITKSTSIAPEPADTEPTVWLNFLSQATRGDRDLQRFLQMMSGYSLTGLTIEQSIFFHHGGGGNGKGTFFDAIRGIMGDYAVEAAEDTFAAIKNHGHTTDLAMLQGPRLVTAAETERGRAWNMARLKRATGGDPFTARFMRQDNFTFVPKFKLWIMSNAKPAIGHVDDAAKRRFRLIPWLYKPEAVDKGLGQKLRDEWPAILRWMIDGCVDWQAEHGLPVPEAVKAATSDYLADEDSLGQWLLERCEVDPEHALMPRRTSSSKLFKSWSDWCGLQGEQPGTNKAFSEDLRQRGFEKKVSRFGKEFLRISLRQVDMG